MPSPTLLEIKDPTLARGCQPFRQLFARNGHLNSFCVGIGQRKAFLEGNFYMRNRFSVLVLSSAFLATFSGVAQAKSKDMLKEAIDPSTGKTVLITVSHDAQFKQFRYGTIKITNVTFTNGKTTLSTDVFRHVDLQAYRQSGEMHIASTEELASARKIGEMVSASDCDDNGDASSADEGDCGDGGDDGGSNGSTGGSDGSGGESGGNGPVPTNPNPTQVPTPPTNPANLDTIVVTANTSSVSTTETFSSDGYYWSIGFTWTRTVTVSNGTTVDGPWSAPVQTVPKRLSKIPCGNPGGAACPKQ